MGRPIQDAPFRFWRATRGLQMSTSKSYKRDYHQILPVKWINRELWKWLRAHVALEDRVTGEVINELIDRYKSDTTGWLGGKLEMTSCYEPDIKSQLSSSGVDLDRNELWRWLNFAVCGFAARPGIAWRGQSGGEILNELIYRYRNEKGLP